MADVRKRIRRQISDATEDSLQTSESEESSEEYENQQTSRKQRPDAPTSNKLTMVRPKRASGTATNGTTSATISRSTSGTPDDRRQSIRLTVKAPPSKLREVMRVNEVDALQDVLGGGKVVEGPRRSRNAIRISGRQPDKPRYAEYGESDIEDDEDEDDEEVDEDEEDDLDADEDERMVDSDGNGVEEEVGSDEEEEDEEENDDDDDDDEMEDGSSPPKKLPAPKPPKITLKTTASTNPRQPPNPTLVVTPANVGQVLSVEDQEMEDDLGDEEEEEEEEEEESSSELSDEENKNLEVTGIGRVEGEELEDEGELDEDDEELDSSDEDTPGSGSATPDLTKMTKRQRGRPEDSTELMALDMAPQQRKFFTDQEKAMKKDEHARKRKELTKRKIQEEKAAALNRLLKPQASKARGAAPKPETLAAAAAAGSPYYEEEYQEKADPLYTRWVSNKNGIKLGVPEEWVGKRIGRVLGPPSNGALIQEL